MRKVTAGGQAFPSRLGAAHKEQKQGCGSRSLSDRNLALLPAESPRHRATTWSCRQKMKGQVSPAGFSCWP